MGVTSSLKKRTQLTRTHTQTTHTHTHTQTLTHTHKHSPRLQRPLVEQGKSPRDPFSCQTGSTTSRASQQCPHHQCPFQKHRRIRQSEKTVTIIIAIILKTACASAATPKQPPPCGTSASANSPTTNRIRSWSTVS